MKITNLYPEITALMVLDNAALAVSVTPKAQELKLEALEQSALVGRVDNAAQQEVAVAAQLSLDNVIRSTEKARKAIKAPVIELGRKIDTQAEAFIKELQDERSRVTKLLADFQALELARVRAAEAAVRLDAESLERKRQEELAAATDLDHIEAIQQRFNAQSAELAAKPVPAAAKAEGQVVRNDWDIEVVNPYDLAKFHPDCVQITPKPGAIKELLRQGISVRGIKSTPIIKVGTRAVSSQKLIEV